MVKKALISGPNAELKFSMVCEWNSMPFRDQCVQELIESICDFTGDDPDEYTFTEYEE